MAITGSNKTTLDWNPKPLDFEILEKDEEQVNEKSRMKKEIFSREK